MSAPPRSSVQQARERVERLLKKAKAAKENLRDIEARQTARQRKRDTRRHVILGASLCHWAERDPDAARTLQFLLSRLTRDQDREMFKDWRPPSIKGADVA